MSSDETQAALSRAFELVEAGSNEEARAILDPILAANPNNADAWWVYAHAADDAAEGQRALEKVVSINPDYPGAAELLAMARERFSEEEAAAPPPPSLPEADFAEPDFDLGEPTLPPDAGAAAGRSRRSLIGPLIAVVIIVVLIVLVVLSQLGGRGTPTPTATPTEVVSAITVPTQAVAQAATEAVTPPTTAVTEQMTELATIVSSSSTEQATSGPISATEITAAATEQATTSATETVAAATEQTTAEATAGNYAALQQALAQFPLAPDAIQETQTSFGPTLQVTACSASGREMRTLLPKLMNAFAQQSQTLDRSIKAISVQLVDCDANSPLVTVAVGRESSQAYESGLLTAAEFAARWKPQ